MEMGHLVKFYFVTMGKVTFMFHCELVADCAEDRKLRSKSKQLFRNKLQVLPYKTSNYTKVFFCCFKRQTFKKRLSKPSNAD